MDANVLALKLFPEWPINKRCGLVYALRCQAHRLRKFGFEAQINLYSPRELVLLATLLPDYAFEKFLEEALRRAEVEHDDKLVELLRA